MDSTRESQTPQVDKIQINRTSELHDSEQTNHLLFTQEAELPTSHSTSALLSSDDELLQDAQKQPAPPTFDTTIQADAMDVINHVDLPEPDFDAIDEPLDFDDSFFNDSFNQPIPQDMQPRQQVVPSFKDVESHAHAPETPSSEPQELHKKQEVVVEEDPPIAETSNASHPCDRSLTPTSAQQDIEVADEAQNLSQGSSAAPIEILDDEDGDQDIENPQALEISTTTRPRSVKHEPSPDLLADVRPGFEEIARSIELDNALEEADSGTKDAVTQNGYQGHFIRDDDLIDLTDETENNQPSPALADARFTDFDDQDDIIEVESSLPDNHLANMLREFTANSARAAESAKIEEAIEHVRDINSEEEDARASSEFARMKAAHEAKLASDDVTPSDIVRFRAAVQAEANRKRLRKSQKDLEETEFQEEHSIFFPESKPSSPSTSPAMGDDSDEEVVEVGSSRAQSTNDRKRGYEYLNELSDADNAHGEDSTRGKPTKRGRKATVKASTRGSTTASTPSSTRGKGPRGGRRGGGRGGRGRGGKRGKQDDNLFDMTTLLPYDMVAQSARNREQGAQPDLGDHSRRHNALADLIASLPDDQRDLHIGDRKILENAVKAFSSSRTIKPHEGKWKLKGMNSALHHYQTIGASKMRDRENEGKPFGGLLSDDMGLGKTVMAIANIIDGRPTTDYQNRTKATLIVAPAALQKQWYNEILKHADRTVGFIKNILIWKSSALQPSDPVALLNNFDVVITSYHELLRSFPKKEIPPELVTARAKEEWWEKYFEENKGVLHQVKWHRIILDEAQAIKNHLSRTSEAAWRLRGKFRWTLSGTPVVNSLEEFFAYFRFLKLWITGDFETWKKNFCKKGSTKALNRLRQMLGKMMIRRTHQDQLFGKPIIQLPPLKFETIHLEFSVVERALYKIVHDRFLHRIRAFGSGRGLNANYSNIFVLLLRLRQLTAHLLLVQKTIKDLLHQEDLEKLWQLTKSDEVQTDPQSRAQAQALSTALANAAEQRSEAGTPSAAASSTDGADTTDPVNGQSLSAKFRGYLESMRTSGEWDAANQRTLCPRCGHIPVKPHVTSCLHIYCFACLNELAYVGLLEEQQAATCLECNITFKVCEAYAAQPFTQRGLSKASRSRERDVEENLDWFKLAGPILQSTKTAAAVKQIEAWLEENPENKILLFSQWRGMLKVFSRICEEKKWYFEQFHGEMSFDGRNKAVESFSTKPRCRILLAAMKAGGVGLNLTAANRVILIDLWWNVAMEQQAYCRVFRIGQTRDVEVVRFSVKNTVDGEMLQMQDRKTKEIDSAMKKGGSGGKLTTEELLQLFGVSAPDGEQEGGDDKFIYPEDPYEVRDSDMEEENAAMDGL